MALKISSRNIIKCIVSQITRDETSAVVGLTTVQEEPVVLTSVITAVASDSLNLTTGSEVYAVIKSSDIILGCIVDPTSDHDPIGAMGASSFKISARNAIHGIVTELVQSNVMSIVKLVSGSQYFTSVITNDAVADLGITVGKEVVAIVKSSNIMIAKD